MKSILTLLFIACIATSSFAQGNGSGRHKNTSAPKLSPEDIAKKRTEALSAKISLTPEQFDKIYRLSLDRINAVKTAKRSIPVNEQLIKEANTNFKEAMRNILTATQLETLKSLKKDRKDKDPSKSNKDHRTKSATDHATPASSIPAAKGLENINDKPGMSEDEEPDFDL